MIDIFIKGLESLNIGSNELNRIMHKLNDEPREQLIDRLKKFNKFANNLDIKVIKGHKNCILSTAEYISNGKILKIKLKHIDLNFKDKCRAYCSELPFGRISPSSYINIKTVNVISFDVEINENYLWGIELIKRFAASIQLTWPHFLGFLITWQK